MFNDDDDFGGDGGGGNEQYLRVLVWKLVVIQVVKIFLRSLEIAQQIFVEHLS